MNIGSRSLGEQWHDNSFIYRGLADLTRFAGYAILNEG